MSGQTEVLSVLSLLRPWTPARGKIRIGALGDGGYVLPNDLEGLKGVLSIGVGSDVSFDHEFAQRGLPVHQYDPTVAGPPLAHENFHFQALGWGVSDEGTFRTLETMVQALPETDDLLLKFDVEGAEWAALSQAAPTTLQRFRVIACELHGLQALHDAGSRHSVRTALEVLTRFHCPVHLHANNCCGIVLIEGVPVPSVLEVTLVRRDRSVTALCSDPIPSSLDYPNMSDRPDLVLRVF